MHKMEELKEMLVDELERLTKKGELTSGGIDVIDKLTHSIKSIDTILAMEGYSGRDNYGNDYSGTGYSYARRDSRGRYSRDLKDELHRMEDDATDEHTRQMIRRWMRDVQ